MFIEVRIFLILFVEITLSLRPYSSRKQSRFVLNESILDKLVEKFGPKQKVEQKSEEDEMLEYLKEKPWRAGKVKHLPICYRPWKDNYLERYRTIDDDTIYQYTIPEFKSHLEKTRVEEIWFFPWMWTKIKADRLGWIEKQFLENVDMLSVQEHMEMDNFFSEFDMPVRWGILRLREFDVLNMMSVTLCYYTDFNGVKPTDLGLRPDGTVRVCPVQFHNCISSSNDIRDTEHYAAPFKWDRSKSPDQAYEEIKSIYFKYPKLGLKWSSGWIDRGGWKPQQFSGPYFYAQADSLVWHFTDDIELVLDNEKREVQYRSQMRLGQVDWDVQRLRYNQFVRMLEEKGGWEVHQMDKLQWMGSTPYRWTQLILDKVYLTTLNTIDFTITQTDKMIHTLTSPPGTTTTTTTTTPDSSSPTGQVTQLFIQELSKSIEPVIQQLQPISDVITQFQQKLSQEPIIHDFIQYIENIYTKVDNNNDENTDNTIQNYIQSIVDKSAAIFKDIDSTLNIQSIINNINDFLQQFIPTTDELNLLQQSSLSSDRDGDKVTIPVERTPTIFQKLLPRFYLGGDVGDIEDATLPETDESVLPDEYSRSFTTSTDNDNTNTNNDNDNIIDDKYIVTDKYGGYDTTSTRYDQYSKTIHIKKSEFLNLKQKYLQPINQPPSSPSLSSSSSSSSSSTSSSSTTDIIDNTNPIISDDNIIQSNNQEEKKEMSYPISSVISSSSNSEPSNIIENSEIKINNADSSSSIKDDSSSQTLSNIMKLTNNGDMITSNQKSHHSRFTPRYNSQNSNDGNSYSGNNDNVIESVLESKKSIYTVSSKLRQDYTTSESDNPWSVTTTTTTRNPSILKEDDDDDDIQGINTKTENNDISSSVKRIKEKIALKRKLQINSV